MFDWVQKLESNTAAKNCLTVLNYVWLGSEIGIKHCCMHIIGLIVFNYRTQIKPIIASDPVHFIEQ